MNKKKSPEAIKTENLVKLFNSNVPGQKLHNRDIKPPFKGLIKKLNVDHFS